MSEEVCYSYLSLLKEMPQLCLGKVDTVLGNWVNLISLGYQAEIEIRGFLKWKREPLKFNCATLYGDFSNPRDYVVMSEGKGNYGFLSSINCFAPQYSSG